MDEPIAARASRAAREEQIVEQGDVEFTAVNRRDQEYNSIGHYRELGRFRDACEKTDRRVQLAGDYHSSQNLNAAATGGEWAASRLDRVLS